MERIKPESIILARTCLHHKFNVELIAKLCCISDIEAADLVENYKNDSNKNAFIITVAALLQQQNEKDMELSSEITETLSENVDLEQGYINDARLYPNYSDGGVEFIAALCNISDEEAQEIRENYLNDSENRADYIKKVAAMLKQHVENNQLER